MEAPPVDRPIVPMRPVDPPVTPQETVQVLGNPDILAQISGRLPLREQQRLERVSRDVQQAVQEVGARREQRLYALTANPRMQQLTLHARSRLQARARKLYGDYGFPHGFPIDFGPEAPHMGKDLIPFP